MQGLIRIVAGAAVALAVAGPVAAQSPQRGGTLNFGVSQDPPTYDCHATDTFAMMQAMAPFYSTLLRFDLAKYPEVTSELARSWTVSPDGLTYTFELHPNAKFHDGTPLTSADVKATYERLRNPPAGVVSLRRGSFADISAIETPGPHTVVFRLSAVNPAMLSNFASPFNCIYQAAKLEQDQRFPVQNVLGSGAFRFVEHVRGSHLVGERFTDYYIPDRPYLDGFRIAFIPQSSAMINALQAGQIMAEFRTIGPADRSRLEQAMGNRMRFEEATWNTGLVLIFNTEKKPFDDVRVRRALSLAIDRNAASQGLRRTSILRDVGAINRPGSPFAMPAAELATLPGFGTDINAARAEARRLLQEAGVSNLRLVLSNRSIAQPYTPAGVFLVDQWRQIGVTAEHRQLETSPYVQSLGQGNYEVALDFVNQFMDEPNLTFLRYISSDRSPENRSRAIDRELDGMYDRLSRETNAEARLRLIRDFERRAMEQAYQVPFLWWHRIVATDARLRGWEMSPSHLLGQDLVNVWIAPN
jgi:peptide/nickel transport system substrate-binding protein